MAECLYHKSLPARVGEEFSFSKIYLVEKEKAAALSSLPSMSVEVQMEAMEVA